MSCILMLVDANLKLLDDAACMVSSLHDCTYSEPTVGGQRVGAQFRHIIEFYESFLDGLAGPSIDYDARKRDVSIERSRSAALAQIESLTRRLSVLGRDDGDMPLRVVAED